MLEALAPRTGETVVDIGWGTGSFALMLKRARPDLAVVSIDPDAEARAKGAAAHLDIEWRQGFAEDLVNQTADAVVSSLVLHQVPLAGNAATLCAMYRILRPGDRLLIADYGRQRGLMRLLFRLTVQHLDGVSDTHPMPMAASPAHIDSRFRRRRRALRGADGNRDDPPDDGAAFALSLRHIPAASCRVSSVVASSASVAA
ncbi:class I SAM-dependent methyltransferase [Sphingomonas sp. AP4-R1]|uniref:class I SAM-dependent methyltransferase n=1 Tax=Sphingomonas sp. AP4-R1 TaxID=2735134 RepID=UPI0020A251A4|nr:class I SAM-dependent methyltransferase [Sphingomonas sp. AP4-R1]